MPDKNDTTVTSCATKSQKMQNEICRKRNLTGSKVVNIHRKEEYCTISSGVKYRVVESWVQRFNEEQNEISRVRKRHVLKSREK